MTEAPVMPTREQESDLPLQQFLTYRFSRVQAKLNAQATRLLRAQAGITLIQWRIIALIGAAGRSRSSELSRHAALDKGLLSRNLKTLIADGLVTACDDDTDNRAQNLALSPRGRQLYDATLPVMRARQRALRGALDPRELACLYSALDKLEIAADLTEFA